MKSHKKAHARGFTTQKNKTNDVVPTLNLNKKQIPLAGLDLKFAIELQSRAKIAGQMQGIKT